MRTMTLFRIASPLLVLVACSDYEFIAKDEAPVGETGEPVALEAGIEVSPEFLSQTACTSVENSITVTSTGDGDLEVLEMLIEGSGWGFAESISFPFTLGPGESREVLLVGSQGEGLLRILSDAAQNPELQVPLESLADAAPTAQIVAPAHDSIADVGEDVLVEVQVSDDMDAPETLSMSVISSQDGTLHTGFPDASGLLQWTWPSQGRSDGPHQLEVVAADSCENTGSMDISICQQAGYTVDDLDISTWNFEGAASWDNQNNWLQLTPPNTGLVGTAFQTSTTVPAGSVSIEFLFYIGDGSGADGISLTALDVNRMSGFLGSSGGGIGYGGLPGWTIEVDTYYNGDQGDPTSSDHLSFHFDGDKTNPTVWAVLPEMEDTGWHTMNVEVAAPNVRVQIDGVTYIDQNLSGNFNFPAYVGFTAGTGALTNRHLIDSLEVTELLCEE